VGAVERPKCGVGAPPNPKLPREARRKRRVALWSSALTSSEKNPVPANFGKKAKCELTEASHGRLRGGRGRAVHGEAAGTIWWTGM